MYIRGPAATGMRAASENYPSNWQGKVTRTARIRQSALGICLAHTVGRSAAVAIGPSGDLRHLPSRRSQSQPRTPWHTHSNCRWSTGEPEGSPEAQFEKNGYRYTIERKGDVSVYTVRDGARRACHCRSNMPSACISRLTFCIPGPLLRRHGQLLSRNLSGLAHHAGTTSSCGRAIWWKRMGRANSAEEITVCFGCHSTRQRNAGKLTLDSAQARSHLRALSYRRRGAHASHHRTGKTAPLPPKLGDMGAEDMSTFCGQCHRTWDFVVRKREWGEVNVRFAPYRLANSECFLGADKRIRCTACHDPHGTLERDEAGYDRACLACHATPPRKSCPVAKNKCVSCHMPKVSLSDGHDVFTDHQIRIARPGDPYPN